MDSMQSFVTAIFFAIFTKFYLCFNNTALIRFSPGPISTKDLVSKLLQKTIEPSDILRLTDQQLRKYLIPIMCFAQSEEIQAAVITRGKNLGISKTLCWITRGIDTLPAWKKCQTASDNEEVEVMISSLLGSRRVGAEFSLQYSHPWQPVRVQFTLIEKEFKSAAKPLLLKLHGLSNYPPKLNIVDRLILKEGDDLCMDMYVQIIFTLFNDMWENANLNYNGQPVRIQTYTCLPVGKEVGFIECVQGCKALRDFDNKPWEINRNILIATAAASYIGSYILNARDRHNENILIKEDGTLFHIDFGFVFGSAPKLDANLFAITKSLKDAMGDQWDNFVDLCVDTLKVIRDMSQFVIGFADGIHKILMPQSKVDIVQCLSDSIMTNDNEFEEKLRKRINKGPKSTKLAFKNFVHGMALLFK